jgi:hypothetical protein
MSRIIGVIATVALGAASLAALACDQQSTREHRLAQYGVDAGYGMPNPMPGSPIMDAGGPSNPVPPSGPSAQPGPGSPSNPGSPPTPGSPPSPGAPGSPSPGTPH